MGTEARRPDDLVLHLFALPWDMPLLPCRSSACDGLSLEPIPSLVKAIGGRGAWSAFDLVREVDRVALDAGLPGGDVLRGLARRYSMPHQQEFAVVSGLTGLDGVLALQL